jgi:hypothetical protein
MQCVADLRSAWNKASHTNHTNHTNPKPTMASNAPAFLLCDAPAAEEALKRTRPDDEAAGPDGVHAAPKRPRAAPTDYDSAASDALTSGAAVFPKPAAALHDNSPADAADADPNAPANPPAADISVDSPAEEPVKEPEEPVEEPEEGPAEDNAPNSFVDDKFYMSDYTKLATSRVWDTEAEYVTFASVNLPRVLAKSAARPCGSS